MCHLQHGRRFKFLALSTNFWGTNVWENTSSRLNLDSKLGWTNLRIAWMIFWWWLLLQVMELFSPGWRTLAGCIVEGFWAGGDFSQQLEIHWQLFQGLSCWLLLPNMWSTGGELLFNYWNSASPKILRSKFAEYFWWRHLISDTSSWPSTCPPSQPFSTSGQAFPTILSCLSKSVGS